MWEKIDVVQPALTCRWDLSDCFEFRRVVFEASVWPSIQASYKPGELHGSSRFPYQTYPLKNYVLALLEVVWRGPFRRWSGLPDEWCLKSGLSIFEKLFFAITSRMLKILTEHKVIKNRLDSKLQIDSTCSIRILNILKVIAKNLFFKNRKMRNPAWDWTTYRFGYALHLVRWYIALQDFALKCANENFAGCDESKISFYFLKVVFKTYLAQEIGASRFIVCRTWHFWTSINLIDLSYETVHPSW